MQAWEHGSGSNLAAKQQQNVLRRIALQHCPSAGGTSGQAKNY